MKVCLYELCDKEIESTNPKTEYCSTKCRVYAGRRNKRLLVSEDLEFVVTSNGGKYPLDEKQKAEIKEYLDIVLEPKTKPIKSKATPTVTQNYEPPPTKVDNLQEYKNKIAHWHSINNQDGEDWENLENKIKSDENIPPKQKQLLIQSFIQY